MRNKVPKDVWHDLKLSMFWIGLALLAFSAAVNYLVIREYGHTLERLETCQSNFEVWSEQIESGHVVVELKGGVKGGE